jgi:hypothetical protein
MGQRKAFAIIQLQLIVISKRNKIISAICPIIYIWWIGTSALLAISVHSIFNLVNQIKKFSLQEIICSGN